MFIVDINSQFQNRMHHQLLLGDRILVAYKNPPNLSRLLVR
jgi:hypothetical protein